MGENSSTEQASICLRVVNYNADWRLLVIRLLTLVNFRDFFFFFLQATSGLREVSQINQPVIDSYGFNLTLREVK